jgi:hypothetical protein
VTSNYGEAGALELEMPTANFERGLPIAGCTLDSNLAAEWPQILRATGP